MMMTTQTRTLTRNRILLLLYLLLLVATTTFHVSASPSDYCTDTGTNTNSNASAASSSLTRFDLYPLTRRGAEAHAIVVTHAPALSAFESTLESVCPTWRNNYSSTSTSTSTPSFSRRANLISILVATADHHSAIYYGSVWSRALDSRYQSIMASMNTYFRNGQFDQGVNFAIQEIAKALDQTQAQGPPAQSASTTTIINQAPILPSPSDYTAWHIFLWIVLISGLAGLIYTAARIFSHLYGLRQERRQMQQEALMAQQEAQQVFTEYANSSSISSFDISSHSAAKALADSATVAMSNLGRGNSDPSDDRLSAGQYAAIRDRYRKVTVDFLRAGEVVAGDSDSGSDSSSSRGSAVAATASVVTLTPNNTTTTIGTHPGEHAVIVQASPQPLPMPMPLPIPMSISVPPPVIVPVPVPVSVPVSADILAPINLMPPVDYNQEWAREREQAYSASAGGSSSSYDDSTSTASSDYSNGGSSSDWSSGDSGSISSSSDSGGSSSFDSGSSSSSSFDLGSSSSFDSGSSSSSFDSGSGGGGGDSSSW